MENKQQQITSSSAQFQKARQFILNIQGLPKSATPEKLAQILSDQKIQPLSCFIQISQETKQCENGFGNVTFSSRPELVNAAKILNGSNLDGSTISIRPTANGDYNSQTSIFIKQLPEGITEKDLIDLYSKFGLILATMVPFDNVVKKSKGIAFIDFDSEEAAHSAIQNTNGHTLPNSDQKISVTHYQQIQKLSQPAPSERQMPFSTSRKTNLFVNRVPFSMTEQAIKELFSQHGSVRSVKIKKPNLGMGMSSSMMTTAYAIAYVDFDNEQDAQRAKDEINGKDINGNILQVDFYEKNYSQYLGNKSDIVGNENLRALFLKGIDKHVTEERLQQICSKYGTVNQCQLKTKTVDGQNLSRGNAQVVYSTKEEAGVALQKLYYEDELGDQLSVDFYKLKEGRLQEYDQQNNPLNFLPYNSRFPGPMMNRTYSQGMPNQAQNPLVQNQGQYYMQQQPRYTPRQNTQQYQNQRPSMPQQQQYQQRTKPRYSNSGNQQSQHPYQKNPRYNNQQQYNQRQPMPTPGGYQQMMPMAQAFVPFQGQQMMGGFPPMQAPIAQPQMQFQPIVPLVEINISELQSLKTQQEQREYLGNLIYEHVEARYKDEAPKITGMILDQPIEAIVSYCNNRDAFIVQIDQAFALIQQERAKTGGQIQ